MSLQAPQPSREVERHPPAIKAQWRPIGATGKGIMDERETACHADVLLRLANATAQRRVADRELRRRKRRK